MQSNFVDSIAEGRCRPTAARNEDSQFGSWSVLRVVLEQSDFADPDNSSLTRHNVAIHPVGQRRHYEQDEYANSADRMDEHVEPRRRLAGCCGQRSNTG